MVLVLVVGVVLGYAVRDIPIEIVTGKIAGETESEEVLNADGESSETGNKPGTSEADGESGAVEVHAFPASTSWTDIVLPKLCLTHFQIDSAAIRSGTSEFGLSMFLAEPVVQELLVAMSEEASPSFGPLIAALAEESNRVDLYILPPADDFPVPILLLTADWPEVGYDDLRECLQEPISSGLPESKEYSRSIESFTMEGVRAPNGNISYVVTEDKVWICNNADQLEKLFATEPPPPSETESSQESLLENVPAGPIVAVLNLDPKPEGVVEPAGPLAFLWSIGLRSLAVGWGGRQGDLVVFGRFGEVPGWVEGWSPLGKLASLTPGTLAILEATLPEPPSPRFTRRVPFGERSTMEQRAERVSGRPSGAADGEDRLGMLTRFFPPAQRMSIRLAVGEEEPVVWSVHFEDGDEGGLARWSRIIADASWSESEESDGGLREVMFHGGPLATAYGVERLLYSETEDGLTFYPSEEAARLLTVPSGSTGEIVMEPESGQRTEPQIHAAISKELLGMLVEAEEASLPRGTPSAELVGRFIDLLAKYVSPFNMDLLVTDDGIRIQVEADNEMAVVIGPMFVASAFLRGGL